MLIVYNGPPHTEDWFTVRREGITGTDLPKILGLSRYGNAMTVWLDKRGELPAEPAGEAASWGLILEEPVAQEWARRRETKIIDVGVVAHPDRPWQRASLDRLVMECPDGPTFPGCALEVKTRNAFTLGQWEEGIPEDVLAQVAWGRLVSGQDHVHVATLVGGQKMVEHRYDADPELEARLVEAAAKVWDAVQSEIPPVVAPDGEGLLLALLNRLVEEREGDRELEPEKATELVHTYLSGRALEAEGKAVKTRAQTALVQLLGDGERALVGGDPLFTYKTPAAGWTIPAAHLKAMREDDPTLWASLVDAGYVTETSPAPRFALSRRSA